MINIEWRKDTLGAIEIKLNYLLKLLMFTARIGVK